MAPSAHRRPLTDEQRELAAGYTALASLVANDQIERRPSLLGPLRDEVRAAAFDGLIDAAQKFRAGRGIKFSTYARHRIRGAIQDWMRSKDHLTRHYRLVARSTGVEAWRAPLSLDRAPRLAARLVDHGRSPFAQVERMQIVALLEEAASRLPDHTRAVLALRYTEEWGLKEIGRAMGYSESRACQVLQRAHEALRAQVGNVVAQNDGGTIDAS